MQFARQSSLGLEIFHESTLAVGLKGVAQINAGGMEFIRAYGTFPSPNVLAGFLGICLFFVFYLFLKKGSGQYYLLAHSRPASAGLRGSGYFAPPSAETMPKQSSNPREGNTVHSLKVAFLEKYLLSLSLFVLSFGLMLTFSRGVIVFFIFTSVLFFVGVFLLEKLKKYKTQAIKLAVLVVVSWLFVIAVAWPEVSSRFLESTISEPAIQERLFFNKVGTDTISQNYSQLFFGVGIGNFVNHYMQFVPGLAPYLYQPVHNIYILIASEVGILGLVAFIVFLAALLWKSIKRLLPSITIQDAHDREHLVYVFSLLLVACFVLFIGMYDHYFWTLQQGGLMFWITLGLLAATVSTKTK